MKNFVRLSMFFLSTSLVATLAQAEVVGTYQVVSVNCMVNDQPLAVCSTADSIQVSATEKGYLVQALAAGKVEKAWTIEPKNSSSPQMVLNAYVSADATTLRYDENRVMYFPGDARRQFYTTRLVLSVRENGSTLSVRSSQVRETGADVGEAGSSEIVYSLK